MSKLFAEKLILPNEREGFDALEIEGGRYAFFKALFSKTSKMAKINLYAILFALPAIICFFYTYLYRNTFNNSINYSGNIGLGYSMIQNAVEQGNFAKFFASLMHHGILAALMILAFIGLGGAFYAMRKLAQGDERITKNFFKGIKVNFADFFLHGLLAGIVLFIFAMNFSVYDAFNVHIVWKVFGIIGASLLLVLILGYLMYACTISTFYKAGFKAIIKDSFLFVFKLPLQTLVFSLLGAIPVIVLYFSLPQLFLSADDMFVMLTTTVGVSLFLFLGISFVVSAWTVYSDYIFELGFGAAKTIKKTEVKKKTPDKSI